MSSGAFSVPASHYCVTCERKHRDRKWYGTSDFLYCGLSYKRIERQCGASPVLFVFPQAPPRGGLHRQSHLLLGRRPWDIPEYISHKRLYKQLAGERMRMAEAIGVTYAHTVFWEDMQILQWDGDTGIHAHNYLTYGPMGYAGELLPAVFRVYLLFMGLCVSPSDA